MANKRVVAKTFAAGCPCGSGKDFAACCGRFIEAGELAPSAEALMRSRYTAYTREDRDHLLATWAPETRPQQLEFDEADFKRPTWLGLKIHRAEEQGDSAIVEFTARFRIGGGSAQRMHETSRFRREHSDEKPGAWLYIDGDVG